MTQTTPPRAISVSVLFYAAEDRLALVVTTEDNSQLALMLTRRFAARLVNGFAQLLERTNSAAQEAPLRSRGDIVMFEHQGALTIAQAAAPSAKRVAATGAKASRAPCMLMDAVDVKITPNLFILILKSGSKAMTQLQVTRGDLHCLLALLRRKCDEADWHLKTETRWLDLDAGSMTLN